MSIIPGGFINSRTAPRAIIAESGGGENPTATPDFSLLLNAEVNMTGNLTVTGTIGLGNEVGQRYYTTNGYTLTVLGTTGFRERGGVAAVEYVNRGSAETPDIQIVDLYALDAVTIQGGGSEAASPTINFLNNDVATITLAANLTVTSVINLATGRVGKRRFNLNGFSLVILGVTIGERSGIASVNFINWGTTGSPDIEIVDNYGANPTGEVSKSFTWTSSQILSGFTTPQEILPAPGSNKAYRITHYDVMIKTYGGTPYATQTNMTMGYNTSTNFTGSINVLGSTDVFHRNYIPTNTSLVIANQAIKVFCPTSNPTAGNSDIDIILWYILIDMP